MKTALICGISGQDGSYLAELLLGKGYVVVGTSRDAQAASFHGLETLGIRDRVACESMALNDFRSVLQVLSKVRPDEIYNLAGQSSVGLSFDQPVETMESIALGTLNLLESVRFLGSGARFYSAGSSECFGNTWGKPANEDTPFEPRSPYAVAKAAAKWETSNYREAYGLFACTGILFNHESPLRPERFVTSKVISAASRISKGSCEKLHLGNLEIIRDWGWAPEYVAAMWLMLQQDTPSDFVIGTGRSYSLREFVAAVFRAFGLEWEEHVVVDPGLFRTTDILESRADAARAKHKLGWEPSCFMPEVVARLVRAKQGIEGSSSGRRAREQAGHKGTQEKVVE